MGAMKSYAIADRVGEARLFEEATKALARANGLAIAFQKGTGLFLRPDRSPQAIASLKEAASAFARRAAKMTGVSIEDFAVDQARQHDVTAWWTWDFRNDAPRELLHDDEYFAPQDVDRIGEEFGGDMQPLDVERATSLPISASNCNFRASVTERAKGVVRRTPMAASAKRAWASDSKDIRLLPWSIPTFLCSSSKLEGGSRAAPACSTPTANPPAFCFRPFNRKRRRRVWRRPFSTAPIDLMARYNLRRLGARRKDGDVRISRPVVELQSLSCSARSAKSRRGILLPGDCG
jgi:hypothetical protein